MIKQAGGLNRRDFLILGAAAGPAGLVAACGWDGGVALEPKLRAFSQVNDWVGEKIFLSRHRLAPEYPIRNDILDVARTVRLSRATMRNIRQNLFFAFIYNAVGIPVAAGLLYPVFGVLLSPIIAAAAMAASSVSVVLDALRLRQVRIA